MRGTRIAIGPVDLKKPLNPASASVASNWKRKQKKIMKPTPITNQSARQFPLVDYHYHTATLGRVSGRCVKAPKSFHDISRDYFDIEANHDFLSEAAVFATLIITATMPIVGVGSAVLQLCRILPL